MEYKKGDIVIIDFPFSDLTRVKKRPAIVISNDKVNKTGDILLVQIPSKYKSDGLSYTIQEDDFRLKKLPLESYIRLHKLFLLKSDLVLYKFSELKAKPLQEVIENIIRLMK